MMRAFRNALAFLSRLVPPPPPSAAPLPDGKNGLADAVPFYPLAGAVLGLIAALPAMLFPAVAAWLYPLILAWLTRGLHWDGLADLADGCGSNATGSRFWEIVKDSRIGAFGVMALVFGIAGQMLAAHGCIGSGALSALILAPAYGRAMVIVLGRLTRPHPASTLAALIQPGTGSRSSLLALAATLAAAFLILGPLPFLAALGLTAACLAVLIRIASRHGGANGDFYGAMIIAAETAVLLAGGL